MELLAAFWGVLTNSTVLLGFLIFTLFVVLRYVLVDRSNGLPPGPRFRFPLVGNMYAVEPDMRKFLRRFRKRYGDIYSLYLGNKLVIIIAGYDNLREAFVKNADTFSDRPKGTDMMSAIAKGLGVVNTDGDLWKEHRKFSLTTLRNFGMGRSFLEDRIQFEVQLLLKAFQSKGNNAFDPEQLLYMSISNVMCSLSFGGHFQHDDARFGEMLRRFQINFQNIGMSAIGSFIPQLAYLPGDMFKIKETLHNADVVYGWLREFVNEHLVNFDENNVNNFASAFIKEMKQQEASEKETTFTVEQLVHLLGDFFVAGTETTSNLLRWMLVYLVNYPDIQEQLFNDISDAVGNERLPSLQDKPKLPLVDAFTEECLRHANLSLTSLGHATSRDVTFHGYLIPREATILADIDSVNIDKSVWEDPEVFRPQRFIDESGSLQKPEEFMPFFIGRRSCLGESLARMELFLFLSAIVQNFKISAPPGADFSLDALDNFGLTHTPKPYYVLAALRGKLPC